MAIREGEVAIIDEHGRELLRHKSRGFLGEISLLTGQTAYLSAVVTQPLRYIAVERDALRQLMSTRGLWESSSGTFIARRETLQAMDGIGFEIIGPRSSAPTRKLVDFARRSRFPTSGRTSTTRVPPRSRLQVTDADEYPLVRLPGGIELRNPSDGELSARWELDVSSPRARTSTLL